MEGPPQVKSSVANTEEPIKLEGPVQSPDSSDHSDGAVSPPPNCSICLGKLVNTSFTDSCLHQFCFTCLLQWSKIKTECPLCKQTFKSIIHNVRSEEDYDQYHVPREATAPIQQPRLMASFDVNFEIGGPFDVGVRRFRTTMSGGSIVDRRSNRGTILNPEQVARREQIPSIAPQVSREERCRRCRNPTDYRRAVYRDDIWSAALPDRFGQYRECSADYYRRELRELNRLIPWVHRELEVLLTDNASHTNVLNIVVRALTMFDIGTPEFYDILHPHLGVYTAHFSHELQTYARSNFDLVGYDQSVTYAPQGLSNELVPYAVSPPSSSSSSSSDDSSIRLLDDNVRHRANSTIPSVGPHSINMPGPSTVEQVFSMGSMNMVPQVFIISSESSASDAECEVIGFVKPRHERTPEIIELLSSEPEEISSTPRHSTPALSSTFYAESSQPSTSHSSRRVLSSADKRISSTAESASDSDTDYSYKRSKYRFGHQGATRKSSRRNSNSKRRDSTSHSSRRRLSSADKRISSTAESASDSDTDYSYKRSKCRFGHRGPTKKSSRRNSNSKRRDRSTEGRSHTRDCRNRSSSGESESRKRKSRKSTLRSAKTILPSSGYSAPSGLEVKKNGNKRSRSGARYSTRGSDHVRSAAKKEEKYTGVDSSTSGTSSEDEKIKSNAMRKSRRDHISSSSEDSRTPERIARFISLLDRGYSVGQSVQRSSSESSYVSQKYRRTNSKRRESQRYNEFDMHEERGSVNNDTSRKKQDSKLNLEGTPDSSYDTEKEQFRSSSQCSDYSSKSHSRWKRWKHKDRRKSKEQRRSPSKTFSSSQPSSSIASASSASSKPENHSIVKHSDSKSSKGKHKSRKSHKGSKHRRSGSEVKSKSRKRGRRSWSSSSSNSD